MTTVEVEQEHPAPVQAPAAPLVSLKKAVDTLAIVPTRDKISLLTRKVYNVMMHHAQSQGPGERTYRTRLRDVINLVDFNSNNTEVLKNYFRSMVTTRVEWQSPTKGEGKNWGVSGMIAHAELATTRTGEVMLEWSYSPLLQEAILDPQRYARISLNFVSQLRTHAGLVLYEICSRYVDNPGGLTARNHWTWWRPVLTGAPEGTNETYEEWKYFKRDCIVKAVAEVNAITNLQIESVEHRQGRAMGDLQFRVRRKDQPKIPLRSLPNPVDLRDIGRAIELGIPQAKAEKLYERHGAAAFRQAVDSLDARLQRKDLDGVRNPEKFLGTILEAPQEAPTVSAPEAAKESRAKKVALIETYRERRRAEAESLFNELPVADQTEVMRRFEASLAAVPAAAKTYAGRGLAAPMTRGLFLKFLAGDMFGSSWEHPSDSQLLEFAVSLK